jgi:hypothetical protein
MLNDLFQKRFVIVLLTFAIFVMVGNAGMAETNSLSFADRTGRITGTLYVEYPLQFDGRGNIDRVGENEVVIDDTLKRLADGAMFSRPMAQDVPKSTLKVGDIVGFITSPEGDITSIWVLEHISDLVDE